MNKIDLSCYDANEYYSSINIENIKRVLSHSKYKIITDRLEILVKSDFNMIKKYVNIANHFSVDEKKEIENAFSYTLHRKKKNFMNHFKKLNIKSCPFCNNNYIYFYTKNVSDEFNTLATLEHYYPKAVYPHLSLSFYNLIPCCSICNSKFKGTAKHVGKISHPYIDDFNANSHFSVKLKKFEKDLKFEIDLKTYDEKSKASVDRFKLDEIYKQHDDIAKEIWNKAQYYNESRIEELYESFYKKLGYTKEDVKKMVFCNYLKAEDINKRNHSKLTQDILKQFDLKI